MMRIAIRRLVRSALCFAFAGALTVLVLANSARAVLLQNSTIDVGVSAGPDSGNYVINVPSGTSVWNLGSDVKIFSSTDPSLLQATINSISVGLDSDPNVNLGFAITNGAAAANFTFSSPVVTFSPTLNPNAFASAAITVTDLDSSPDGATATGLFPGIKAYQAQYNGAPSIFANLVSPVNAPTDSSNIGSDRFPAAGTVVIGGIVSSIQSQFSFQLSANDSASGTSRFNLTGGTIVPEPSSLVLALLGGLGLLWRVRRRFF